MATRSALYKSLQQFPLNGFPRLRETLESRLDSVWVLDHHWYFPSRAFVGTAKALILKESVGLLMLHSLLMAKLTTEHQLTLKRECVSADIGVGGYKLDGLWFMRHNWTAWLRVESSWRSPN